MFRSTKFRPSRIPSLEQLAFAKRHRQHSQRTLTRVLVGDFRAMLTKQTQDAINAAAQQRVKEQQDRKYAQMLAESGEI